MTDRSDVKALVTGGSQGIGLGIAEAILSAGAAVAISGRRPEMLAVAADQITVNAILPGSILTEGLDRLSVRMPSVSASATPRWCAGCR